jgi:hypothetical protein
LQNKRSIGITRFWVRYTTPATGLTAFTRYDAIVTATETASNTSNATHDELYSGFLVLTKSVSVVSTGCPAGVTPAYANGTCPGGVLLYTIDYRNIIAGAASEPATMTWPQASSLTITEPGTGTGSTWPAYTNGLKEALVAGANGTTTFGDSTAASILSNASAGSASFTDQVGGATFKLVPQGTGSWQGTLTFRVVVK